MDQKKRLFVGSLLFLATQVGAQAPAEFDHALAERPAGIELAMMDGPGGHGGGDGPGKGGQGGDGPGGMQGGGPERMLKGLDLTDDQKQKLKALRRERRDKNQARRNALQDAHEDIRELLGKADRSKAHVDKLRERHREIERLEAEQMHDRFESILEVRAILTDKQLKKFVEQMHKGGMKMRGMKDRGGKDEGERSKGGERDGDDHKGHE